MTSSDLGGLDAKGQTFLEDLRNYAPIFLRRASKFGKVTHVGRNVFLQDGSIRVGSDDLA